MATSKKTVRVEFTPAEADELMGLIKWARRQTYAQLTDNAIKHGYGQTMWMAASKLAVITGQPNWSKDL